MSTESQPNSVPLLNPVKQVKVGEFSIEVKELTWQRAIEFMGLLSKHAGSFLNDAGKFEWNISKFADVVTRAGELTEFLIVHSTGKTAEWLREQSFVVMLELLNHALEVNLSPAILQLAKKTAARFALASGVRAAADATRTIPPLPASSISSSGKDGATPTS